MYFGSPLLLAVWVCDCFSIEGQSIDANRSDSQYMYYEEANKKLCSVHVRLSSSVQSSVSYQWFWKLVLVINTYFSKTYILPKTFKAYNSLGFLIFFYFNAVYSVEMYKIDLVIAF